MNTKFLLYFRCLLLAVIFMQVAVTKAQNDYQTQIDSIFNIPAHKVTTGVLINRSPNIIEMQNFKLHSNTNNATVINSRNWFELFYRLYASHLNLNSFSYDKMLIDKYPEETTDGQISLGLIYYQYEKIKNFAVQNGLLSVDTVNQKITDISPVGQSPLELDTCFAISLLVDSIIGKTNTFILKDSLFVSNKKSDIQEIYIDFGNGQGYVRVYPNQPVTISFSTIGNKTLTTKVVVGSKSYYASSCLYVNNPLQYGLETPKPDFGPSEYDDNGIKAEYGIWYRCNHDNTLRKPLLIVSGFDPQDRNRIWDVSAVKDKIYLYNVANKDGFLHRLRELGYDVIIYRSKNSTKSIIPNAMNLAEFIKNEINDVKTSDNELIVVGTSMGGLVCRYALAYMENKIIPHKTKLFISMDSPQNGANVPLGFQFMAYYLNKDLLGSIPKLNKAVNEMLDCVAAREMLIYHHSNTSGNTANCARERNTFLSNLSAIGNYPKECKLMAISMGSGTGKNQGFNAGANLIKKNPSLFLGTTLGLTLETLLLLVGIPFPVTAIAQNVTWEFEVNAVPNQTTKSIYKENISLDVCIPKIKIIHEWWMILLGIPPILLPDLDCSGLTVADRNEVVNNTMPLDNAPGSITGFHNLKTMDLKGLDQIFNDFGFINIDQNYDCFIPAYSALGLNVPPLTNIKSYLNTCSGVTQINNHFYFNTNKSVSPFDYLYIENDNLFHIYDDNTNEGVFSPEMLAAMDNMISSKNLYLENKTIVSGQSVAYEASESISAGYSVDDIPANNGDFIVESGGSVDMRSKQIFLKPGFRAKNGSNVRIKVDDSWVCPEGSIQSVSLFPLLNLAWEEVPETQIPPQTQNSEEEQTLPIIQKIGNEIRFFPNPVENILNLQLLNRIEGEIRITVINSKGQPVYSRFIKNSENNVIDCSQFISGVYFVMIEFKDSTQTIKIIKK